MATPRTDDPRATHPSDHGRLAPAEEGAWETDASGRLTFVSARQADMLGRRAADMLGRPLADFVEEADLGPAGWPEQQELRLRHASGKLVWALVATTPLFDGAGQLRGARARVTDVSGRREIEEQRREAAKLEAVGRLAGGVAHEFNNLLTAIIGYSELVISTLEPGDERVDYLRSIRRAGDRAAALTRQLLAFGRKAILAPKALDLNDHLKAMAATVVRALGEATELRLELGEGHGMVKVDPGELEQVVLDLAANARDAMPQGGAFTLTTTRAVEAGRAWLVLAARDTGRGMDEPTRARIFEPFFTTKPQGQGQGLGLAVVHGVIHQSGGRIDVDSAPGHGTTFRIYLPEVARRKPSPLSQAGTLLRGCETVLLVEDDDSVRGFARATLDELGYAVLEADCGEQALRLAVEHDGEIGLLLTDVVMPGLGGREVAERLAEVRPGIRVLFTSGYTADVVLRHGVEHERVAFLPKPFTPAQLSRKVREVLDAV